VPAGTAYALNVMTMRGRAVPLLRRRPVTGQYANTDATVRASVVVGGSVSTADGHVVAAPAVVPAGVPVSTAGAEILEVAIGDTAAEPAVGGPDEDGRSRA
jgi:hypothetical protein